jgi:predicted nucleic acid-binding protein
MLFQSGARLDPLSQEACRIIFVDTGAWFPSLIPTDPDHASATARLAENSSPLLTTDYVIDETLTLLRARGERTRALLLGARFFRDGIAEIHKITEPNLERDKRSLCYTWLRNSVQI